jgi:Raf kinase inhibitor-like YbhB/YbcL family protein
VILESKSFTDGAPIPGEFAFCIPHDSHHVCLGGNRNPQLQWREVPEGTRSFALICHDPDVPSKGDDVNQEGRSVPASLPRVDFFHWVLVNLAPETREIDAGEYSDDVTPRGKSGPASRNGASHGINDYTNWFAGDRDMSGHYFGYDGPCPPWNDELRHRYVFTLFALDVTQLPLEGPFTGADARQAMAGHILAQASITGTYSLNPALGPALKP